MYRTTSPVVNWKWIDDPLFDFRSLGSHLGYINYSTDERKEVTFAYRIGIRKAQSTQGLSKYNVKNTPLAGNSRLGVPPSNITWDHYYGAPFFAHTVVGNYPSLRSCVETLQSDEGTWSIAFNRKFALRQDPIGPLYIQYRGKDIGYTENGETFRIHEDFKYLTESLDEIGGIKVA